MLNNVLNILQSALQDNLTWVLLAIICVSFFYLINSILGLAMAYFKSDMDIKYFFLTQARNIVVLFCVFWFCYALNVFVLTLDLIDNISINTDYTTALEAIAIVVAWCIDLSKSILDKLKSFKTLEYVKLEDIEIVKAKSQEQEL